MRGDVARPVLYSILMAKLILVRHGESRWNLANRFTGWIDVPLSENGIKEAERVARHCRKFRYDAAFTSSLSRAQETCFIILSGQDRTAVLRHAEDPRYSTFQKLRGGKEVDIPVVESAALNERYYGSLQGQHKGTAARRYGKRQVFEWRRGYDARPPDGETLRETHARVGAYLRKEVLPLVTGGRTILVVAHGNSLRATIKQLEGIDDEDIAFVDLPEAKPLVYERRKGGFVRVEGEYRTDRPLR